MKRDSSNVLIADDVPQMQRLLASYLRDMGFYEIDVVDTGEQVIEAIQAKDYRLAFIDIEMPSLGGLAALPEVVALSPATGIVMVSSHGTLANVKAAIEMGAKGFLVKPFSKQKLEEAVSRVRGSTQQV